MCKYCKHLQQLRKEEKILYSKVLKRYKNVILNDEKLFRRCLNLMDTLYENLDMPGYMVSEYANLSTTIEDLLEGGVSDEKNKSS